MPAADKQIHPKVLAVPRVTPIDIEGNIVHTEIVTHVTSSGQTLRWAVLTLQNGYAVTGAPSYEIDEEIGREYAIINAKEAMFPLMAYALKQRLHDAK